MDVHLSPWQVCFDPPSKNLMSDDCLYLQQKSNEKLLQMDTNTFAINTAKFCCANFRWYRGMSILHNMVLMETGKYRILLLPVYA